MRKVLALEPHFRAPQRGEARRIGERGGPAHPARQLGGELAAEIRRMHVLPHALLEPLERRNQGFRHVAPAKRAEASPCVGEMTRHFLSEQPRRIAALSLCIHAVTSPLVAAAARTLAANRRISAPSFTPARDSTPLETSTPKGCTAAMAAATLAAFSPPAST